MSRSPWMAFIWLTGLVAGVPAMAQSRPAGETELSVTSAEQRPAAAAGDPWSSPEIAAPRLDDDVIRRPHTAVGVTNATAQGKSSFDGLVRTSASLAGVVGLIILLAWGYRAASGASGRLGRRLRAAQPGLIQILARTSLGPRQGLYLVRVGPQLVLLGTTHDSLRALTVVQDADLAARLAGQHDRPAVQRAEFQTCLSTEEEAYAGPADVGDSREALAHLDSVKQRLSQTLRRMEKVAAAGA
jgi:flagellar biogenesis protein FliO